MLPNENGTYEEGSTIVTVLSPAEGQSFAYALTDGGVALVVVADGRVRTTTMSAAQAQNLGEQLINSAALDSDTYDGPLF